MEILNQQIDDLSLNDECKLYLKQQGFSNLQEIVAKGWAGLRALDNFDYIQFNVLIRFLKSHNLLSSLENQAYTL